MNDGWFFFILHMRIAVQNVFQKAAIATVLEFIAKGKRNNKRI
jgi:hypothetical protein